MKKCNQLSLDTIGLFNAIQNACVDLVKDTAEKIKEEFAQWIYLDGAGRHVWRENAGAEFNIIATKIASDVIEAQLGMPQNIESEAKIDNYLAQIMVALYGNHGPLYTKPGEVTFHNHMESRERSRATTVWRLPKNYNWDDPNADKMLANSMKICSSFFKDGVNALLRNINFYDYVNVTAG